MRKREKKDRESEREKSETNRQPRQMVQKLPPGHGWRCSREMTVFFASSKMQHVSI